MHRITRTVRRIVDWIHEPIALLIAPRTTDVTNPPRPAVVDTSRRGWVPKDDDLDRLPRPYETWDQYVARMEAMSVE
jgi:hypothetical protein